MGGRLSLAHAVPPYAPISLLRVQPHCGPLNRTVVFQLQARTTHIFHLDADLVPSMKMDEFIRKSECRPHAHGHIIGAKAPVGIEWEWVPRRASPTAHVVCAVYWAGKRRGKGSKMMSKLLSLPPELLAIRAKGMSRDEQAR